MNRISAQAADPDWLCLRNSPLFAQIESPQTFDHLKSAASVRRVTRRAELFSAGERPRHLCIALQSQIELVCSERSRSATFAICEPLTPTPLDAVLLDQPSLVAGSTLAPGCVVSFPSELVRAAVDRDKGFARGVMQQLAHAQRAAIVSLKAEKFRNSIERLASWIVENHDRQGRTGSVKIPFCKRTLASQLGMAPENLSRTLAMLARYGVKSTGRYIHLHDPDALYTVVNR